MNRREMMKLGATAAAAAALPAPAAAQKAEPGEILMLVYPKFTALDLVGPHHTTCSRCSRATRCGSCGKRRKRC